MSTLTSESAPAVDNCDPMATVSTSSGLTWLAL